MKLAMLYKRDFPNKNAVRKKIEILFMYVYSFTFILIKCKLNMYNITKTK